MKKKWLIGIASCLMVLALSFGLAACGDKGGGTDDNATAQQAIGSVIAMYENDDTNTANDYKVRGSVTVGSVQVPVSWTVSSDVANYSNYVSVSKDDDSYYTVHVVRTTVDVPYKLNASVTVGSVTKTASFDRKVPLTQNAGVDTVNATLDFKVATNRKEWDATHQIWEASGIRLTNTAGGSPVADYTNPARFYKGSKASIAFTDTTIGILHVDFTCHEGYNDSPYSTWLETDLKAQFPNATVTHDEENHIVGIQLAEAVSVFEFTFSSGQIRLYSIVVEGAKISDETIIASAKESLELGQTVYFIQDTATLPTEYNGTTITWAIKETTTYASVSGSTLTISSLPTEGTATVTLVATISAGSAPSDTKELAITLKPTPTLTGEGTATSPYTAADANKIAALLKEGTYYSKAGSPVLVQVKGYVISFSGWNGDFNNWTAVYIAVNDTDDTESENAIQIFRFKLDDTYIKAEADLVEGAELTVQGYLQNYSGTYEITYYGSTNPTATAYNDSRTQEEKDISKALAALADTLTVTETGAIDLPASTVATVTFAWSTENSTYTISGNKLTVSELPATAVTFDATVTATAGTGDAQKTGTKTVKITIQAATSGTEKVLELTPSNFNSTDDGLEKSDLAVNANYGETEFDIKPGGYIKSNTLGTISKIEAEIYGSYDNMKMYAAYTVDTAKQVTGVKTTPEDMHQLFTYTFEGGTTEFYFVNGDGSHNVNVFWIKIYYVEAEGGDESAAALTLKSDSFTVLDDSKQSGYDKYAGKHTVNGYEITLSGVMVNTYSDSKAYNVIQFRASNGTMTLTGEFTSITMVVASTSEYASTKFLQVKAGDATLECTKVKEEATNETYTNTSNKTAYPITLFTVSYAVTTTGSQTIEIKKADSGALYVLSIEFFGEGSTTPGEPVHQHNYTYTYDAETPWKHTGTCNADGECTAKTITEDCTPELNVCKCGHTYTAKEIVDKLYSITGSSTVNLKGTYSLQGKVLRIDTPYGNNEITFTMKVEDKEIQAYGATGDDIANIKPGDTVTVQGGMCYYRNGTREFTGTVSVVERVAGDLTDDEKIEEAYKWLTLPVADGNTITLPTTLPAGLDGVTLAWTSKNTGSITVNENKTLTLIPGSESVDVVVEVTISCGEGTPKTKEFTVTVAPEGQTTKSITFSKDNRTAYAVSSQTFTDNDITVVNTKADSSSNCYDGVPLRLYKSAKLAISIADGNIQKIVFHCDTTSHAGTLESTLKELDNVTVSTSGTTVTITLNTSATSYEFIHNNSVTYISSIDITYTAAE